MIIPHTSCNEGEGEKNIYSALQSTFLVPASELADYKQSPDSASYHGIKKVSKQVWHKKLITTLVFQVTTSGSLPNFAGWSQISHKINTPPGPALRRAPHSCTLSPAPRSRCPGCHRPYGAGRLSPPPAASRTHRDALLAGGTGELQESHPVYLQCPGGTGTGGTAPAQTRFPVPCSPGWSRPGWAGASLQMGGKGAALSPGRRESRPVILSTKLVRLVQPCASNEGMTRWKRSAKKRSKNKSTSGCRGQGRSNLKVLLVQSRRVANTF